MHSSRILISAVVVALGIGYIRGRDSTLLKLYPQYSKKIEILTLYQQLFEWLLYAADDDMLTEEEFDRLFEEKTAFIRTATNI